MVLPRQPYKAEHVKQSQEWQNMSPGQRQARVRGGGTLHGPHNSNIRRVVINFIVIAFTGSSSEDLVATPRSK